MLHITMIGLFGAVGAVCRYLVGLACERLLGSHFAYGTLLVNVVGCFLLGLLMHFIEVESMRLPAHWHAGLTAGFLGALTTFSTFGYQTIRHLEQGDWTYAAVNIVTNVVLGLLAAAGGVFAAKMLSY